MNDFVEIVAVPLVACCVGFVLLIGVPAYFIDKASCAVKANKMSIESSYGLLQGCMVKVDDKWWPIERYIRMEE